MHDALPNSRIHAEYIKTPSVYPFTFQALDVSYAGNFGYLRRTATQPTTDADLTLPQPGSSGSLSAVAPNLVLNTAVASVVSVETSLDNGTYGVGEEIPLLVTFAATVEVDR